MGSGGAGGDGGAGGVMNARIMNARIMNFPYSLSPFPLAYSLFPIPCSLFPIPRSLQFRSGSSVFWGEEGFEVNPSGAILLGGVAIAIPFEYTPNHIARAVFVGEGVHALGDGAAIGNNEVLENAIAHPLGVFALGYG